MLIRRLTAVTLLVAMVAMASSGLLMLVVDRPSFTMRLHPVHKTFGLLMVLAAASHLVLNARALGSHLRQRAGAWLAAGLTALLVAAYALAVLRTLPPEPAQRLDEAARQLEGH